MLTIHHLGKSQSERIVWLCEELGLDYGLEHHTRDPVLSPPELRALHPMGAAPVITDGDILLAESAAIMEYILAKYGPGRLAPGPTDPDFAPYLYWFHFTNGTLQPLMGRVRVLTMAKIPADSPALTSTRSRLDRALAFVEARLAEVAYLAGPFTAADIMIGFTLTTMRLFMPLDLSPYPNILAYLQRIGSRDAYRRAMQKGDPGLTPMLT